MRERTVTRTKWTWVFHVLQHGAGGNRERFLDLVVEQLVGGAGSYEWFQLQRPGSNIQHGVKQLTDTTQHALK